MSKSERMPRKVTKSAVNETSQAELFLSRELATLEFNFRVLAQARDTGIPLLERLRYLSIVANNLDKFFEVRVAHAKTPLALPGQDVLRYGVCRAGFMPLPACTTCPITSLSTALIALHEETPLRESALATRGTRVRNRCPTTAERTKRGDSGARIVGMYARKLVARSEPLTIFIQHFEQADRAAFVGILSRGTRSLVRVDFFG